MRNRIFTFLLLGLFAGTVNAEHNRQGNTARESDGEISAEEVAAAGAVAAFAELERQLITKYFGDRPTYYREHRVEYYETEDSGKGKSKHRKKGLPPGIAMKLERGGTLPPGIAKQNLPDDLNQELPPVPHGYERRIVDRDVLLVEEATGKIADIIVGAILDE